MGVEPIIFSFVSAFLGTLVMTIVQEINIRISKRPLSFTPAVAVFKILRFDFEKLTHAGKVFFSYFVHFGYGTFLGIILVVLHLLSFPPLTFLFLFYFIILIQGWTVLYILGIAGLPWTWKKKDIVREIIHKLVYTLSTTYFFFLFI